MPKKATKKAQKEADPNLLSKKDLKEYEELLLARKELLSGDVADLRKEALGESRENSGGNLSSLPIHMADLGSDNWEQEFSLELMEGQEEELEQIQEALERIQEKTFGRCTNCDKLINKERLRAIPYAQLCIACKKQEESSFF